MVACSGVTAYLLDSKIFLLLALEFLPRGDCALEF